MKRLGKQSIALVAGAVLVLIGSSASYGAQDGPSAHDRHLMVVQKEIDSFVAAHPRDFVGLDRLLAANNLGHSVVRLQGVDRSLTASEAQQLLAAGSISPAVGVSPMTIPSDALRVGGQIYESAWPQGGRTVHGWWDFKDSYINGSAPDDIAGIETDGGDGCYLVQDGSEIDHAYDYSGVNHDSLVWLTDGGASTKSPYWTVRDSASGFKLLTDNGDVFVSFNPKNSGCKNHVMQSQFVYQHAQDGDNGLSVSIGWSFLTISYSNPGSTLTHTSGTMTY